MQILQISDIVIDAGTQIRSSIDEQTVAQYAEEMLADISNFPFVDVFHDGSRYILVDGFHRLFAHIRNGRTEIKCNVHKGTRSDALRFALSANAKHGLKRTNADKRHSVEIAFTEWPSVSDREISKICGVSNTFVSEMRGQLSTADSCAKRIGGDGKLRSVPVDNKPEPEEISGVNSTDSNPWPLSASITPVQPTPPTLESKFKEVLPDLEAKKKELMKEFLTFTEKIEKMPFSAKQFREIHMQFTANASIIGNKAKEMAQFELTNTSEKPSSKAA